METISIQNHSWSDPGSSWGPWGPPGSSFHRFLSILGSIWGGFWEGLGALGEDLGSLGASWGFSWSFLGRFGASWIDFVFVFNVFSTFPRFSFLEESV